jgi:hypothetical protein
MGYSGDGSGFGLSNQSDPDPTQQLGQIIKISFSVYTIEVYEINGKRYIFKRKIFENIFNKQKSLKGCKIDDST